MQTKRRQLLAAMLASSTAPAVLARSIAVQTGAPLPIPDELIVDGGNGNQIDAVHGQHPFLAGAKTPSLGFSQDYLGPLIRVRRNRTARIVVGNQVSTPITGHWHGMHVPGVMDGGPHLAFEPGKRWSAELNTEQPAATLWYHSHVHGRTGDQVYTGLAGMLIVDDPDAPPAGLPDRYGIDDIPLIIQDRAFQKDGQFLYSKRGHSLMHGFRAKLMVVNGVIQPVHTTGPGLIRLRLLNASNARIYTLRFDDRRLFHQVASDAALLPAPLARRELLLSPGERAEILVDFSNGRSTRLMSGPDVNSPRGRRNLLGIERPVMRPVKPPLSDDFELMRFVVDRSRPGNAMTVPATITGAPSPDFGDPVRRRRFQLQMRLRRSTDVPMPAARSMHQLFGINGRPMDMHRIDERVRIGETELWEVSTPDMAHPFHIHGTSFQVISNNGQPVRYEQSGLKDVHLVNGRAELLVRFSQPADESAPYMYHCHILEHEDAGMMGQFTVSKA